MPPIPSFPPCSAADTPGEFCFATVGLSFAPSPDPVTNSDMDAIREDLIGITPMDSDMTACTKVGQIQGILIDLQP